MNSLFNVGFREGLFFDLSYDQKIEYVKIVCKRREFRTLKDIINYYYKFDSPFDDIIDIVVKTNDIDLIESLISKKPYIDYNTILGWSVQYGSLSTVKYFFDKSTNVDCDAMLDLSVLWGNFSTIKYFFEKSSYNGKIYAINKAFKHFKWNIAEYFMNNGCKVNYLEPLPRRAIGENSDLIKTFVSIDIDFQNRIKIHDDAIQVFFDNNDFEFLIKIVSNINNVHIKNIVLKKKILRENFKKNLRNINDTIIITQS
ncbi:hypothetical protein Catovirus_1_481 [Catovirus CTV1]|uniref:Ankyrin repeat protein n=1 Tax=Catovirus CTV1 TaxID=1977631 RepID=A0A1V0S9R2_9VIRU|nr:hypothetical protein Catovirus_1_481 [Catovirus CTV1]